MTTLRQFHPGLWLTELVLDDFAVRGAVIVGEQRVVVWDTLSHPRDMTPLVEIVGDKPIYVVYSHADWDHCWGTAGVHTDVVIGHPACAERFASGNVQAKFDKMYTEEPDKWAGVVLIPPTFVAESATIDLGGVTVELHSLPGHTPDCLVAFIPEWGIFLAGDTVETPLPVLKEGGVVLENWMTRLALWCKDPRIQSVIPSHGEISGTAVIEHTVHYLRALLTGTPPNVPPDMDEFYTATHAANLKLVSTI